MSDAIEVADNPQATRFELRLNGELVGFADYVLKGGTIILTHTEVQPEFEGRGLAARLARAALDGARDAGLTVIPRCPYIASYIERHPEYADLLARSAKNSKNEF
jgi:predicted GNAT family acetyltransferase